MAHTERDVDLVCMGRTSVDLYGEQVDANSRTFSPYASTWAAARPTSRSR